MGIKIESYLAYNHPLFPDYTCDTEEEAKERISRIFDSIFKSDADPKVLKLVISEI